MVSRRVRNDACTLLLCGELDQCVVSAAKLESARPLEVLALEPGLTIEEAVKGSGGQCGRSRRHTVEARRGGLHVVERDREFGQGRLIRTTVGRRYNEAPEIATVLKD